MSQERWDQHLEIQKALKKCPRDSTLETLIENQIIKLHQKLGTGVYGTVYDSTLCNSSSALPLAIKSVLAEDNHSNRKYIVSRLLREEVAYAYLNGLVFLQICPHFSLVHKSFIRVATPDSNQTTATKEDNDNFYTSYWNENRNSPTFEDTIRTSRAIAHTDAAAVARGATTTRAAEAAPQDLPMPYSIMLSSSNSSKSKRRDEYQFLMCMERASGNAKQYFDHCGREIGHAVPHFLCQMLLGIYTFTRHYDIIHNDLYLKNILFHELTSPIDFVYHFEDSHNSITLRNCSVLFTIGDFGICSSPSYLENTHQEMANMTTKSRAIKDYISFDFSKHILEYKNVNPYCRDIATLFRSTLNMKESIPMNWKSWLLNSLDLLHQVDVSNSLTPPTDLCKFIRRLLSPSFLSKNAIKPSIFHNSNSSTQRASTSNKIEQQHYYLDGSNHSNAVSSLRYIASDYLKSIHNR